MKVSKIFSAILKYMYLTIIVGVSVVPILWVLISSFKTNLEILNSALSLPAIPRIQNYIHAYSLAPIGRLFINSVFVSVIGTLLTLLIIGLSSYVISRFEFFGKKILIIFFSMTLLIPGAALLIPIFSTINKLGLYDNIFSLIIVYAGFGIPATMYILTSYYLTIPREMEESGYIDGSSFSSTFFRLILPIARPGFATAAILQFLLCWNEFQFALTLTTGNASRTLPLALYYFKSQFATNYGSLFAVVVIVIIPSIIIYMFLSEQVVSGLASGAVKG